MSHNPRMIELYRKVKAEYEKATKRARIHRPTLYDCAVRVGVSTGPAAAMDNAERLVVDLVSHGLVVYRDGVVPEFRL